MSHIAKIEIEVKDLASLSRACKTIGAELVKDAKEYIWFAGQKKACDHVIRIAGAKYEVGVVKNQDGKSYRLEADFWRSGGLADKLGPNGQKIKQAYGVELARKHYASLGYRLNVVTKEDGSIVVTANK